MIGTERNAIFLVAVLLISSVFGRGSCESDQSMISLKGESIYSLQLDPISGQQAESFSYSLTAENPGMNSTSHVIKLTFHDIGFDSVRISSPSVKVLSSTDLGKVSEWTLLLNCAPGKSTYEITARPTQLPFVAVQNLLVNGLAPNVTNIGAYRFITIKRGDQLDWTVKILNSNWGKSNGSWRIPIPLMVMVAIDTRYFEVMDTIPKPNSTRSSGEHQWTILVKDSVEMRLKVRVSKLSEWGIATLSPIVISYVSDLYGPFASSMKARALSLNATADFLEGIWRSVNSSAAIIAGLAEYLKVLSSAMNATGRATDEIGKSLIMISRQVNNTATTLDQLRFSLDSLMKEASTERINATIRLVRDSIYLQKVELQFILDSQSEEMELLLELNSTLTALLNSSTDPQQRTQILTSIAIVGRIYDQNSERNQRVGEMIESLDTIDGILAQLNATDVQKTLQSYSDSLAEMQKGVVAMSAALSKAGEGLKSIGAFDRNSSNVLSNMSSMLFASVNNSVDFTLEISKKAADLRLAAAELRFDAITMQAETEKLRYLSPEAIAVNERVLRLIAWNSTGLAELLPTTGDRPSFVKYVVLNSSSAFEFWNFTSLDKSIVKNIVSLGAWTIGGSVCIPIFSPLSKNNVTFTWGGTTHAQLVIRKGFEALIFYRDSLGNQTEVSTVTLLQPDLAAKVSPVVIGPGGPSQPPTEVGPQGTMLFITGMLIIVFVYLFANLWKRQSARQKRARRVSEIEGEL